MTTHADTLQRVIDECARKMNRLHDWAEHTTAERESYTWSFKAGKFDQALQLAFFTIGVAQSAGLNLDDTRLNRALERGNLL